MLLRNATNVLTDWYKITDHNKVKYCIERIDPRGRKYTEKVFGCVADNTIHNRYPLRDAPLSQCQGGCIREIHVEALPRRHSNMKHYMIVSAL